MPYVRRTKRRPSVSKRLKIVMAVCLALAVALGLGGLFTLQQERIAQNAADAASFTPAPVGTSENAAPVFEPVPEGAEVLILGDSYTQGFGSDDETAEGYAYVLAESMGWDATVDGVGGSGFTWGDANSYPSRIPTHAALSPDLVILQGGQNDFRAEPVELRGAVTESINLVESLWPDAQILIIGPAAPEPLGSNLAPTSEAIGAAARAQNVPYIDPVTADWFTDANSPEYAYEDGAHLNTEGHAYMASRIIEAMDAIQG